MTRKVTIKQDSPSATGGSPRRNALVPEQGESARHVSSHDDLLAYRQRHKPSPGNIDKEPPKPLPHPATPPRPPRPDGRKVSGTKTIAEHLEDWKDACYRIRNDTHAGAKQRYQGSIDFTTTMIATSETKDFVAWFRAYCDLKPTMGAQDGEKLASIMVEKVRTEGFVGTLMQEQTFQDFLDEKEFAKAVVELFASAIATGGVVGMGGGLGK